tara:strand:+ start:359 stop:805 length:447 start_codon:yes stop_codon:yes gene_type:complete
MISNAEQVRLQGVMSFDDVQERLVGAVEIRRRHLGSGRWPFAGDGPWNLVLYEAHEHGAYDIAVRKVPPTRAELAQMREAFEWLLLVPKDDDRLLIVRAIEKMGAGAARVPWRMLCQDRPRWRTPDGLRMRYERAMSRLTLRLNAMVR